MNCEWAAALTRYDCHPAQGRNGEPCLVIGTPFTLPDGSAINLYLVDQGSHILITDNGDTVFQLPAMGLDIWHGARMNSLREYAQAHLLQLTEAGELRCLMRPEHAPIGFAKAVTGMIAVSLWIANRLQAEPLQVDLVAELQPYVIARDPGAAFEPHPKVRGASRSIHEFDMRHGKDLIDIIPANANSTGSAMRKAGDVQNGPFAGDASPLIIVDDRSDPERAASEIGILASVTRAMAASTLIRTLH